MPETHTTAPMPITAPTQTVQLFLEAFRDMITQGLVTIPRADVPSTHIGYQHGGHVYLLPWNTLTTVARYLADHGIIQQFHAADLEPELVAAGVIEIVRMSRKFPMPDSRLAYPFGHYRTSPRVWRLRGL